MPTQSQRQQHQQQQSVPQAGRKSVPAELLAQQHFERRLLERLEQHVRLTGELPYNEFYELAHQLGTQGRSWSSLLQVLANIEALS